jgi:hypothetical protein
MLEAGKVASILANPLVEFGIFAIIGVSYGGLLSAFKKERE